MNWNKHSEIREDAHAILSPSKFYWVNKSNEELVDFIRSSRATERGTRIHAFAKECIELGQKLPASHKTLNMYVNDAIGYHMTPEQKLVYSSFCFGTADTIWYSKQKKFLRIHDLKTGTIPAHMEQLEVYAAIFCLEYHVDPNDISMELRIYQNDDVIVHTPDPEDISFLMKRIIEASAIAEDISLEGITV